MDSLQSLQCSMRNNAVSSMQFQFIHPHQCQCCLISQGDVSNRNGEEAEPAVKKNRATGRRAAVEASNAEADTATTGRSRRGRAGASKAKETEPVKKEESKTTRRSSSRTASSRATAKPAASTSPAASGKDTKTKTVAANVTRSTKGKTAGGKRKEDSNPQPAAGRSTKRAKKSTDSTSAPSRRSTRSSTSSQKKITSKPVAKAVEVKEIPIIRDSRYIVPLEFRLQRASFDADASMNYTHGIAHYDVDGRDNPLLCKDYVTDMFQHLYHHEVRHVGYLVGSSLFRTRTVSPTQINTNLTPLPSSRLAPIRRSTCTAKMTSMPR